MILARGCSRCQERVFTIGKTNQWQTRNRQIALYPAEHRRPSIHMGRAHGLVGSAVTVSGSDGGGGPCAISGYMRLGISYRPVITERRRLRASMRSRKCTMRPCDSASSVGTRLFAADALPPLPPCTLPNAVPPQTLTGYQRLIVNETSSRHTYIYSPRSHRRIVICTLLYNVCAFAVPTGSISCHLERQFSEVLVCLCIAQHTI